MTGFEAWGNVLLARIDAFEQRFLTELARHTKAIQESMATQMSGVRPDLGRVSGGRTENAKDRA